VAELADALASGASGRKTIGVQISSPAHLENILKIFLIVSSDSETKDKNERSTNKQNDKKTISPAD
jgi:hypothetical protein